jgi:hypothetical protein
MLGLIADALHGAVATVWACDAHLVALAIAVFLTLTFNGVYINGAGLEAAARAFPTCVALAGEYLLHDFLKISFFGCFCWKCLLICAGMAYR